MQRLTSAEKTTGGCRDEDDISDEGRHGAKRTSGMMTEKYGAVELCYLDLFSTLDIICLRGLCNRSLNVEERNLCEMT